MADDNLTLGREFLADLLAKSVTDADVKGQIEETLKNPAAQALVEGIGAGAKRDRHFSQGMDQMAQEKARLAQLQENLETWRGQLTEWEKTEKGSIEAAKQALAVEKARQQAGYDPLDPGAPVPTAPPAPDLSGYITKEQHEQGLKEAIARLSQEAVPFIVAQNTLAMKHYQTFGEVLDMDPLLADPRVNQLGLQGVYDAQYADRYKDKAEAAEKAREAELREKIRTEERQSLLSTHPYPVASTPPPSTLDGLQTEDAPTGGPSVESMAAQYQAAVAREQAGGS
jgi:hypothetical protein